MTVLPIVERELRVAARQRSTYWARLGIALAAMSVAAFIFVLTFGLRPQQTGRHIFEWLSGILLVYCLAYGRRSTADCLSQEKREGTLGLLFLTDLKGLDVVLGKLVATSVRGFYGLLAVFPVLAIPLLLGGITSGEFWRVVLVLIDTFLFSLAIGILGSALTRDLRRAMAANFLLLLLLAAIPPACMAALGYFLPSHRPIPQLLYSCPVFSFYLCDEGNYQSAPDAFWWSVAVIHALTWLLVITAGCLVPRCWQDRPSRAEMGGLRALWHTWRHGPTAGKSPFRQRALDANAFYWLAARARFKPVHVWTFLACMAAWWLVGWIASGKFWLDASVAVLTAVLLNSTLKIWLAIEAGQQLAEDQRTGAFELLLSAPLTVQEIVRGQLLALRRQFLGPLLVVLGAELWFLLAWRQIASDRQSQATWLAGMFMLVADLVALSWVGMSRALVARTHNLATISTLARVLVLPWLAFGAVLGVGNVWYGLALGNEWTPGWQFHLALWLGLGLAADLVFGLTAWWQLRARFRELALRRFNPAPSRFARWFGPEQPVHPLPKGAGTTKQNSRLDEPQRREERGEEKRGRISALFASLRLKLPVGSWRRRLAVACGVALVVLGSACHFFRSHSRLPPAVVVSMNQSNGPVRVCPSLGGALLILPDGSLWRWGKLGTAALSRAAVPERVGTNCDWVQAAAGYNHLTGVWRDGTLWEWRQRGGTPGEIAGSVTEFAQVGSSHDWIGIAASAAHSVALRRNGTLWAWGDNSRGQLGIGPEPWQTTPVQAQTNIGYAAVPIAQTRRTWHSNPVQVGTNSDWAALCCPWSSTLALRRDGTLWAWGQVNVVGTWGTTPNNLPLPIQVCLESNWTGFITGGFVPLVRNRLGELWEPFQAPPNPEATAASSFRLIATTLVPGRFAAAWCGDPEFYEVRSDGTLWGRTQPLSTSSATPVGEWRRLGKRSDWTALWGTGGTALGLTSDGTLWTWGIDPGQEPVPDFRTRLKLAQIRLRGLFGPGPRPIATGAFPAYQKQPRPLMRLVLTNGVPP